MGWDFDIKPVIKNGSILQFNNFKYKTDLNSHDVLAPMSPSKYEVSGYVEYKRGLRSESDWELVLPDEDWWWEDSAVLLRHVTTGKLLSATENILPDSWGQGMREVVGAATPDKWTVVFSRRPRAGIINKAWYETRA